MTLIEVMIFLMLASLAVLGLVSAQIYALRTSSENQERHLATTVLHSLMSEILEQQRQDFSQNCQRPLAPVADNPNYQAAVSQIYTDASDNLKQIAVSVYWTDKEGAHDFSVWTYVYRGY